MDLYRGQSMHRVASFMTIENDDNSLVSWKIISDCSHIRLRYIVS